jgi:hypothetical protein
MGGAGLPFGLILIAALVVIVLLGVFVVVPFVRGESRRRDRLTDPGQRSLVYEVPEGQDPAAIVAALRQDGLEATEVMRQGRQRVVISGPEGTENIRSRAREVIARGADLNLEGDPATPRKVTFADE